MSIKRLVTITCVCDGPCGTTLTVEQTGVPKGWQLFKVDIPAPAPGVKPTLMAATYCPKCFPRLLDLMKHNGYSMEVRVPVAEPTKAEVAVA